MCESNADNAPHMDGITTWGDGIWLAYGWRIVFPYRIILRHPASWRRGASICMRDGERIGPSLEHVPSMLANPGVSVAAIVKLLRDKYRIVFVYVCLSLQGVCWTESAAGCR